MPANELMATIAKVVDAAQEAGVMFARPLSDVERINSRGSGPTFAMFKVTDSDSLNQKAMESAMQNARAEATRLAALAGVALGDVLSVQRYRDPTHISPGVQTAPEGASLTCSEIRQTVVLNVSFRIKGQE